MIHNSLLRHQHYLPDKVEFIAYFNSDVPPSYSVLVNLQRHSPFKAPSIMTCQAHRLPGISTTDV